MSAGANVDAVLDKLSRTYPEARTALNYRTPFQLLVATILSAQCTDKRVNQVTGPLFQRFSSAADFAALTAAELEPWIKTCGLFRTKSKNIIAAARQIIRDFNGEVPATREQLTALPGVGRKTANVVLNNAFGQPAIAVDTHVFRVANRLGLAGSTTAAGTERQLQQVIPRSLWGQAHHWLIFHGREVCKAQKPQCGRCVVAEQCKHFHAHK